MSPIDLESISRPGRAYRHEAVRLRHRLAAEPLRALPAAASRIGQGMGVA